MSKIELALTAEEWADFRGTPFAGYIVAEYVKSMVYFGKIGRPETKHGVAALCLHGQPFGFTREDVEVMRGMTDHAMKASALSDREREWVQIAAWLNGLADRIEALLPPEAP